MRRGGHDSTRTLKAETGTFERIARRTPAGQRRMREFRVGEGKQRPGDAPGRYDLAVRRLPVGPDRNRGCSRRACRSVERRAREPPVRTLRMWSRSNHAVDARPRYLAPVCMPLCSQDSDRARAPVPWPERTLARPPRTRIPARNHGTSAFDRRYSSPIFLLESQHSSSWPV